MPSGMCGLKHDCGFDPPVYCLEVLSALHPVAADIAGEDIRSIAVSHEQATLHGRSEGGALSPCHDVTGVKNGGRHRARLDALHVLGGVRFGGCFSAAEKK